MAELHIVKSLSDKRKEIEACIGSLEQDLEQAQGDHLSPSPANAGQLAQHQPQRAGHRMEAR
jgi:hypothetical protein